MHLEHYNELDGETKIKIQEWIHKWLEPSDKPFAPIKSSPIHHHSIYGVKHDLQRMTGIYVTDLMFREALECSGIKSSIKLGTLSSYLFYAKPKPILCLKCGKRCKRGKDYHVIYALCSLCRKESLGIYSSDYRLWSDRGKIGPVPDPRTYLMSDMDVKLQ